MSESAPKIISKPPAASSGGVGGNEGSGGGGGGNERKGSGSGGRRGGGGGNRNPKHRGAGGGGRGEAVGSTGGGGGGGGGGNEGSGSTSGGKKGGGGGTRRGGGGGGNKKNRPPRSSASTSQETSFAPTTTEKGGGAKDKPKPHSRTKKSCENKPPPATASATASAGGEGTKKKKKPPKKKTPSSSSSSSSRSKKAAQQQKQKEEEEQRLKREAEEKERLRLEAIAEAEALAKAKAEAEALEAKRLALQKEKSSRETALLSAIANLTSLQQTIEFHKTTKERLDPLTSLPTKRKEFLSNKKKLKSDLRKCTAFVKKIKTSASSSWTLPTTTTTNPPECAFCKDVKTLNLSRYVEEIASAILESKIKVTDVKALIQLCIEMHERYVDFIPSLVPSLLNIIVKNDDNVLKKTGGGGGEGGGNNEEEYLPRRMCLRILIEFILHGIAVDVILKPIVKVIESASGYKESKDGGGGGGGAVVYQVADAPLVVSFVKAAGFEILGLVGKGIQKDIELIESELKIDATQQQQQQQKEQEELSSSEKNEDIIQINPEILSKASSILSTIQSTTLSYRVISPTTSTILQNHTLGTYNTLCTSYLSTHTKLLKLEKRCEADKLLTGSLSEQRTKGLNNARKLLETIQKSVEVLSEALNQEIPKLPSEDEEEDQENNKDGIGLELWTKGDHEGEEGKEDEEEKWAHYGPFDDEETKSFYMDLPDLLSMIPPALLGYSQEDVERIQAENLEKFGSLGGGKLEEEEVVEEDKEEVVVVVEGAEQEGAEDAGMEEGDGAGGSAEKEDTETSGENKDTPHYKLQLLLEQELPECNRIETIDALAEKFCVNHGTSKPSRKRLSRALFLVPRTRLDLLPYYSRLAAILNRIFVDVGGPLVTELEQQFHGLARWKKNQSLENRLKNARFLGELTKFRVAPPIVVLRCLKRCLDDFSGFNIDTACCLLECCGRFLYRMKHTRGRLSSLMDTMMRIRQAKNLDERSVALINSAFYMVSPPQTPSSKQKRKIIPPLEAYLRHLLIDRLSTNDKTIAFISKQIQRLPWSDPSQQCGYLVCKYMLKACRKGRYEAVGAVASVAATLKRAKPEVSTRLIDGVLEELQWTMEHPDFRDQQRTIACAKLLGELHCASLVPASLIVEQLYHFVNFGHEISDELRDASEKQTSIDASTSGAEGNADQQGAASIKTPSGVTQTIKEEEEMDEEAINKQDDEENKEAEEEERPAVVATSTHSQFDPRVPSLIDPSSSVYRIKLVCTLLETVAPTIVTTSNKTKLDQFLTAFQRYLFTKTVIPTEVEFLLLDTFDKLDSYWKKMEMAENSRVASGSSGKHKGGNKANVKQNTGFTRYTSWIDAHNATVAVEESDYQLEARAKARLLAQGGVRVAENNMSTAEEEMDDILNDELEDSIVNSDDEDDVSIDSKSFMSESDDESETDSNDDNLTDEDDSDDELEGSEEDSGEEEDDMYDDEEEEIDEAAAQEAYLKQMQDEAFERELRKLTMDALEKGKISARTGTGGKVADAMPAASQVISKKIGESHIGGDNSGGEDNNETPKITLGGGAGISFKVLKRGAKGRVEAKKIVVPTDTNLAKVATKQDDEAARERDILKARVLQYEVESAEQQYSGGNVYMDQTKLQVIRNRPLSMEDIDRNFGSSSGDSHPFARRAAPSSSRDSGDRPRSSYTYGGRGGGGGGGGGRS